MSNKRPLDKENRIYPAKKKNKPNPKPICRYYHESIYNNEIQNIVPNPKPIFTCTHTPHHNQIQNIVPFPKRMFGHYLKKGEYEIIDNVCNTSWNMIEMSNWQSSEKSLMIQNDTFEPYSISKWEENAKNVQRVFDEMGKDGEALVKSCYCIYSQKRNYFTIFHTGYNSK